MTDPITVADITLNRTTLDFESTDETATLTITVAPTDATDKSVTWTSSDETVATVNTDGVVTSVGKGIAVITATTNDGTNLSATCTVTVSFNAVDMPSSIVNPQFANGRTGWTGAGTIDCNCCEFFMQQGTLYQVLNVPNGRYRLKYKAFQRPDEYDRVYDYYIAGTWESFAVMYANDVEKDIKHICDEMRTTKLNSTDVKVGNYYIPDRMVGARAYFDAGLYVDYLDVIVTDGTLTIGVRGTYVQNTRSWLIFSDFELMKLVDFPFADAEVEQLCIANWDIDGNGLMNQVEIDAITDLGAVFRSNTMIQAFDELEYFTGLTGIGSNAFYGCTNLSNVKLPDNITYIDSNAFRNCSSLQSIELPSTLETIGSYAFAECSSLSAVTANMEVPFPFDVAAFRNISADCMLTVPYGTRDAYIAAGWTEDVFKGGIVPVEIIGITLSVTEATLTSVGETLSLTATITPANATDQSVTWTSSDETVATVSSEGVVTLVSDGTATITATTADGSNLTATCMVTCATPAIVFADANVKALCVANWDTNNDGELSKAEAAAVTNLGDVFRENRDITSFDELQYFTGLTSIRWEAFATCTSLTSVVIPNSVTVLEDRAFSAAALENVTLPSSVTEIRQGAFMNCWKLESINIPDGVQTITLSSFQNTPALKSITLPDGITSIEHHAFAQSGIESIILPEGVTIIGESAFRDCTSLTSVTLPNSLTSIENSAFRESGLTSIELSVGVKTVGYYAFCDCKSLTSVVLPEGITTFNNAVFAGCNNLTSVNWPSDITTISPWTFSSCGFTSFTIPEEVKVIGDNAFRNTRLETINLPEGLTTIEAYAFYDCTGLASISIPASVTSIGEYVLSGTKAWDRLTSIVVTSGNTLYDSRDNCNAIIETATNTLIAGCNNTVIPATVTSIGKGAFEYRSGMTSIDLPVGLTSVGDYAFKNCQNLVSVFSEIETPFAFGTDAFKTISDLCVLYIPAGTRDAYIAAGWTEEVFKGGIVENMTSYIVNPYFANGSTGWTGDVTAVSYNCCERFNAACNIYQTIQVPNGWYRLKYKAFQRPKGFNDSYNDYVAGTWESFAVMYANDVEKDIKHICDELQPSKLSNGDVQVGSNYMPDNMEGARAYFDAALYSDFIDVEVTDGTLTIGVRGSKQYDRQWVIFSDFELIKMDGIELDQEELPFCIIGETVTLTAKNATTGETYTNVTWSSSDETVATVSSAGVVTAVANGSAIITATTTEGFGLTATCAVTVDTDNYLLVEDATAISGGKATLRIAMNNAADIAGVQFRVNLPEGVDFNLDGENLKATATSRLRNMNFSTSKTDDYAQVLIYGVGQSVSGHSGTIVKMEISVDAGLALGDYQVAATDIVLTKSDGSRIKQRIAVGTLTMVDVEAGDANRDGDVDVADIISIANYILGSTPATFDMIAADVNGDGDIDVADIICIANMILGNTQDAKSRESVEELDPQ